MRRRFRHLLCVAALGVAAPAGAAGAPLDRPWMDPGRSPDMRAELVVRAMTRDEKIAMVNGTFGEALRNRRPDERRIGAGHVPGVPRLGIPDLYETDASLGVANGGEMRKGDVATALPASLMTAASFDPRIAYAGGAMIGAEARAKGFNILLAGGANLIRDGWNGRAFEYFSEDALLTGRMAGETIRGVQSNGIISTIKHYALSTQESGRSVLDARLGEAALRESDLLAFQIGIEIGQPGSVMCGYNRINGDPACENGFLLTQVLKRDWRYSGWTMSDWGAVHSTVGAANAGLDQESGQELDRQVFFGAPLAAAVASGAVSPARLDDMVRRILRTMIAHGLVDRPSPATPQRIDDAAHAAVAQHVAEAGIVLLKNTGDLLPAAATGKRIVVIGGHADVGVLSGGGSSQVRATRGVALELPMPQGGPLSGFIKVIYHASSPLAAIRARAPGARVEFFDGRDIATAVTAATGADLVFIFAEQWRTEAFDVETLALPDGQDALIGAIAAASRKTVVVLETGGPVLMPWLDQVGAVLAAWYPGERGGEAIARVLFGDVNPSGRLPVTFPAGADQAPRPAIPGLSLVKDAAARRAKEPPRKGLGTVDLTFGVPPFAVDFVEGADVGYRWYQRQGHTPLFPFGYGLSYTRFSHGRLTVTGGDTITARFTVTNTGRHAGADVPQVYAAIPQADGTPIWRLIGFERVMLAPGESRTIEIAADPRLLARYDVAARGWHIAAGTVAVALRRDAGDEGRSAVATLRERRIAP